MQFLQQRVDRAKDDTEASGEDQNNNDRNGGNRNVAKMTTMRQVVDAIAADVGEDEIADELEPETLLALDEADGVKNTTAPKVIDKWLFVISACAINNN